MALLDGPRSPIPAGEDVPPTAVIVDHIELKLIKIVANYSLASPLAGSKRVLPHIA